MQGVRIGACDATAKVQLAAMLSDPRVHAPFFAYGRRDGIEARLEEWRQLAGVGCDNLLFAATDAGSGEVVGCVHLIGDHLSYFVAPAHWGQGYGGAMVAAFMARHAGWERRDAIYTTVVRENLASRRILEKAGFRFAGVFNARSGAHAPDRTMLEYVCQKTMPAAAAKIF
jgi:RimJ/RimL family protein N-acetyltransferase